MSSGESSFLSDQESCLDEFQAGAEKIVLKIQTTQLLMVVAVEINGSNHDSEGILA